MFQKHEYIQAIVVISLLEFVPILIAVGNRGEMCKSGV